MDTLDSLKKELDSTKSLQGIVTTMKSIAAVNIKKFEKIYYIGSDGMEKNLLKN